MAGLRDDVQNITFSEIPKPTSAGLVLLGIARQTVDKTNYFGEPVSPLGVHFYPRLLADPTTFTWLSNRNARRSDFACGGDA